MSVAEVKKVALGLSERQRAILAANLLQSLPPVVSDEDEGVAEAMRRDTEIDRRAGQTLSLDELDSEIRKQRS